MVRFAFAWVVGLASLLMLGCGTGGGLDTVSVSGTVYLDEEPLEGVEVNFFSTRESDFLASGVTGPGGRYELHPGAVVGQNKVWIVKGAFSEVDPAGGDPASDPAMDPGMMEAAAAADVGSVPETEGEGLPAKFSDPDKTELTFKVPDGGTSSADFKLTSQ